MLANALKFRRNDDICLSGLILIEYIWCYPLSYRIKYNKCNLSPPLSFCQHAHPKFSMCCSNSRPPNRSGKTPLKRFICRTRGHGGTAGPRHIKLSIWSSLMCIDRHRTKGTRTIRGCFVWANSFPKKIPRYGSLRKQCSVLCFQSMQSAQCE